MQAKWWQLMTALRQDGIPLYHQLKEIFIEKILDGEWRPGEIIPNEMELCEQYGVSRGPVRRALDQLVREGLLTRKQGKGTWVLPPKIEGGLDKLYSFTTLIEDKQLEHSAKILSFDTTTAPAGVAGKLNLAPGDQVFKISRLRLAHNEPLLLETIYVPQRLCTGLAEKDLGLASLYLIIENCYGQPLLRARQFFEPVVTDAYEAEVLGVEKGAPALLLQNITYTTGDHPVVFSKAIMRGDRVRYFVELSDPLTRF